MTNTQHTPGPWFVTEQYEKGELSGVAVHPAHFYFKGTVDDSTMANTRLIAAAPELLAALKTILGIDAMIDAGAYAPEQVKQAYDAIAKAEGNTAKSEATTKG